MNRRELKRQVTDMLVSGISKREVFQYFVGNGESSRWVAMDIATYLDPRLRAENRGKVWILVAMMALLALLDFAYAYHATVTQVPSLNPWVMGFVAAIIPLAFAIGFYRRSASAFPLFFTWCMLRFIETTHGNSSKPMHTMIDILLLLVEVTFVLYVQKSLYPDFGFFGPSTVNGEYVFTDKEES